MTRLLAAAPILIAGVLVLGSTAGASARSACGNCRPFAPTVHIHTVYKYQTRTIHLDRQVTSYAPRIHRVVSVTRIQPVIDVHRITTVHHRTVYYRQDVHSSRVEYLPAMTFVSSSSRAVYDCNCR